MDACRAIAEQIPLLNSQIDEALFEHVITAGTCDPRFY